MDTHLKNFGPRLRATVEQRGTIESAYQAIGVSRATLFNWFNRDDPPPGPEKIEALTKWLGEDAQWVLDGVQTADDEKSRFGERFFPQGSFKREHAIDSPAGRRVILPGETSTPPDAPQAPDAEDIHMYLSSLIAAADGDPKRLGWIMEELHARCEERRLYWLKHPRT